MIRETLKRQLLNFQTEGYETSSTTMSCTLFEMAINPEIQKQAQEEIDRVLGASKGEITEESVNKLEFLEQCLMETVRVHCPVFHLSKINLKETELPPQYENSTKSLKIEAGMNVVIPVHALHL